MFVSCGHDLTESQTREKGFSQFDFVVKRLREVEERDRMRAFQSPVRGEEIMQVCGLNPGPLVGKLKTMIEEAIPNEHDTAYEYLLKIKDEVLGKEE